MVKSRKVAIFQLNLEAKEVPVCSTGKTKNKFLCKNKKSSSNANKGIRAVLGSLFFFYEKISQTPKSTKAQKHKDATKQNQKMPQADKNKKCA